jgi:hypothetical protein
MRLRVRFPSMRRIVGIIVAGLVTAQLVGSSQASATSSFSVPEQDWVEVTNATHPPANGALVYDPIRNENVLFVPAVKNGRLAQTWTFNGTTRTWTKKNPAHTPLLYNGAAAFDDDHDVTVLIGNAPTESFCDFFSENETWTWDGNDWTQQHPATAPTGCFANTVSFDARLHRVVAETADFASGGKTFLWNGTTWNKVNTDSTPSFDEGVTAYNPYYSEVMLFGGLANWHGPLSSAATYAWFFDHWNLRQSGTSPGDPEPRGGAAMTWDSTSGSMLLFGGRSNSSNAVYNDTFRWNGVQWTRIGTTHRPEPAVRAALADNPTSGAVLFNGSRTWVFTNRTPTSGGYAATNWFGKVATAGEIPNRGDLSTKHLNKPIVGIARTPSRQGYWLVASDGGIFTFGDARYYGSTGATKLNKPIVGMAATPSGQGYWLVASDGGIFTFGDARFYGSTGAKHLNKPVIGMAAAPTGDGYWLLASDGGVFTFGWARFFGSTGAARLNKPIVGMAATPTNDGYWLVASDGGIFTFGQADFKGAVPGRNTIVAIAPTPSGNGYHLFANNGAVQHFGDAPNLGNLAITAVIAGAGA